MIAGMADYPAAVVHQSYDNGDPSANPIGTGPYLPDNERSRRQAGSGQERRSHLVGHRRLWRPVS